MAAGCWLLAGCGWGHCGWGAGWLVAGWLAGWLAGDGQLAAVWLLTGCDMLCKGHTMLHQGCWLVAGWLASHHLEAKVVLVGQHTTILKTV